MGQAHFQYFLFNEVLIIELGLSNWIPFGLWRLCYKGSHYRILLRKIYSSKTKMLLADVMSLTYISHPIEYIMRLYANNDIQIPVMWCDGLVWNFFHSFSSYFMFDDSSKCYDSASNSDTFYQFISSISLNFMFYFIFVCILCITRVNWWWRFGIQCNFNIELIIRQKKSLYLSMSLQVSLLHQITVVWTFLLQMFS